MQAAASTGPKEFSDVDRKTYDDFLEDGTEKLEISIRMAEEIQQLDPNLDSLRIFDAGTGDGTILYNVLKAAHARYPKVPFYVVGQEINGHDAAKTFQKIAAHFGEHPNMVFVMTNMKTGAGAPTLTPKNPDEAQWFSMDIAGSDPKKFSEFFDRHWGSRMEGKSLISDKPVVLTVSNNVNAYYNLRPERGNVRADYNFEIGSHLWRSRRDAEFKARNYAAPLTRGLAHGGKLVFVQAAGENPALDIVQEVWPGEEPFPVSLGDVSEATIRELGGRAHEFNFSAVGRMRYELRVGPGAINGQGVDEATMNAAWRTAVYATQMDGRADTAYESGEWREPTRNALVKHNGLWLLNDVMVVERS